MRETGPETRQERDSPRGWSEDLCTGFAELDHQHRHLFRLVDDFRQERSRSPVSRRRLAEIFDELVEYGRQHFAAEETVFSGHPMEEEHRTEHEIFVRRLIELQAEFGRRTPQLDEGLLFFLQTWLVDHIRQMDTVTLTGLLT